MWPYSYPHHTHGLFGPRQHVSTHPSLTPPRSSLTPLAQLPRSPPVLTLSLTFPCSLHTRTPHTHSTTHYRDNVTLDTNLATQDSPKGAFPISRYVYWYVKRSASAYDTCYQAWLLCTFIKWTYTESIAAEIALDNGWVVPPLSVVKVALAKSNEVQCIDTERIAGQQKGGESIAALSYIPLPYRVSPEQTATIKDQTATIAGLGVAGGVLLLAAGMYVIWLAAKHMRRLVHIKDQQVIHNKQRVQEAIETTKNLNFPVNLVRAADFLAGGALTQHETLRDEGKLIVIDGLKAAFEFGEARPIVFFSHQWCAFGEPDHTNEQFEMMCTSLRKICQTKGWKMETVVVWVDYSR